MDIQTVFIGGARSITELNPDVTYKLDQIIELKYNIVIGDAPGVDSLVQSYLHNKNYNHGIVYHVGLTPRNNIGNWVSNKIRSNYPPGTRKYYTEKDLSMIHECNYGFMIWDNKSLGTLHNILNLRLEDKLVAVYVNPQHKFHVIQNYETLHTLIHGMSSDDFSNICKTLNLEEILNELKTRKFFPKTS
jgi:hypothetical protein